MMQLVAATPCSILSFVQYHSCSLCDTVAAPAMSTTDLEKNSNSLHSLCTWLKFNIFVSVVPYIAPPQSYLISHLGV